MPEMSITPCFTWGNKVANIRPLEEKPSINPPCVKKQINSEDRAILRSLENLAKTFLNGNADALTGKTVAWNTEAAKYMKENNISFGILAGGSSLCIPFGTVEDKNAQKVLTYFPVSEIIHHPFLTSEQQERLIQQAIIAKNLVLQIKEKDSTKVFIHESNATEMSEELPQSRKSLGKISTVALGVARFLTSESNLLNPNGRTLIPTKFKVSALNDATVVSLDDHNYYKHVGYIFQKLGKIVGDKSSEMKNYLITNQSSDSDDCLEQEEQNSSPEYNRVAALRDKARSTSLPDMPLHNQSSERPLGAESNENRTDSVVEQQLSNDIQGNIVLANYYQSSSSIGLGSANDTLMSSTVPANVNQPASNIPSKKESQGVNGVGKTKRKKKYRKH